MKALVCVKRVIDYNVKIRVKADKTGVETENVKMSMGGDRGILVKTNNEQIEPLNVGKIIQSICKKENPDMVILGKQAIDDDCNQTGQIVATLLGYPQATFASEVKKNDDNTIDVTREVDGGLETIRIAIPCVITTDLRLNEPRYASLPNIMKAKQKKIEVVEIQTFDIDIKNRLDILEVNEPPERKPGIKVQDVESLVNKLKNEAKIL